LASVLAPDLEAWALILSDIFDEVRLVARLFR